jgi:ABC-type sugar transport system permease subunit
MSLSPVERAATRPAASVQRRSHTNRAPYIFVAPFFILFTIFFLGPSLFALGLSFFKWNAITTPKFIGLTNYVRLVNDPIAIQAISNTAIYMVASLFLVMPLALVLAVVLNSPRLRLQGLWRAMYFSPIVTSAVAITLVFVLLYSRDYGLLNYFLSLVGLGPVDWLGDAKWAKPAIIGLILWRWTGYNMIYFLAGMQGISQDNYEAAQLDGANGVQQFFNITVPLLRPIILYVSVITMIGSAQIFDEAFILTQGGPANSTLSIAYYLYQRGLGQLELGYASTIGLFLFVVIFMLSLIQLRAFGAFRTDGA